MDHRCPSCGGLLYSQRSRMCSQCGAVLPPEMVLSDEKAETREKEREWARNLADKFDTTSRQNKPATRETHRARYEAAEANPDEIIRPVSCAAEFRQRKRRWVWILVGAQLWLGFLMLLSFPLILKVTLPTEAWLIMIGVILAQGYFLWLRAVPVCPNCKRDIRTCLAMHCHVCGTVIKSGRCLDCGVDNTWTGWFRPYQNGSYQWITFCPGCGVELDTCIPRWRPGQKW